MIADHGEFRVNFIWDRPLVEEDGAAPQDCKSPQERARRALSGLIRVSKMVRVLRPRGIAGEDDFATTLLCYFGK